MLAPHTILIGNGDILSLEDIQEKYEAYAIDGYMIGRGIFANPWLFNKDEAQKEHTIAERVALYHKHISLYYKEWGGEKNFANLKKFAKTYISNFPEASQLREELMTAKSIDKLLSILKHYDH